MLRTVAAAIFLILGQLMLVSCTRSEAPGSEPAVQAPVRQTSSPTKLDPNVQTETAILAGGCFWGMEELLRQLPGVVDTAVGYTGGRIADPKYGDVKTGRSGHAESVQVVFDPSKLSYERLLLYFFSIHDPTTKDRQGNDVGSQYRSAIFVLDDEQRSVARKVIDEVDASGDWKAPVTTEVVDAAEFHPAEEYHQDYLQKNPGGYTCHFPRDVSFY
jgi:peptide methionine sulfoxide reductase msrA/msrB